MGIKRSVAALNEGRLSFATTTSPIVRNKRTPYMLILLGQILPHGGLEQEQYHQLTLDRSGIPTSDHYTKGKARQKLPLGLIMYALSLLLLLIKEVSWRHSLSRC
jgi:hypothetical protein